MDEARQNDAEDMKDNQSKRRIGCHFVNFLEGAFRLGAFPSCVGCISGSSVRSLRLGVKRRQTCTA
jgi:hypothetical protein